MYCFRDKKTHYFNKYSRSVKTRDITVFVSGFSHFHCISFIPGNIQIRGMLKHLIDFSSPTHNLLLTDLELSGFRPGHSQKGINDMSTSARKTACDAVLQVCA